MSLPHRFYEDEVIDGFYVPGEVKASWAVQLDVLKEIDRICKKHHIQYYAEFGTMLGAVRHNGCIPWDDDFDISMKRKDYNRFIQIAKKEMPEQFYLMSVLDGTKEYRQFLSRIINNEEVCTKKEFLDKNHGLMYVAGIDIFCLDNVPKSEEQGKLLTDISIYSRQIARMLEEEYPMDEIEPHLQNFEELVGLKVDRDGDIEQQMYANTDRLFGVFADDEADYLCIMPTWIESNGRSKYPKEYYDNVVMMPFENTQIPVPAGYDHILKKKYGDYMRLVKSGGGHEYPFTDKQRLEIEPRIGHVPYRYYFDEKDLQNPNRPNGRKPKQQIVAFAELLSDIHIQIYDFVEKGDVQNAAQLLISCQELTENMCQLAKNFEDTPERSSMIECFEIYSGSVVGMFEAMCSLSDAGGTLEEFITLTAEHISRLEESRKALYEAAKNKLPGKQQVVFIPYKASTFKTMEHIWREYAADENNEVYVMPVPYLERTSWGEGKTLFYDADAYPEDISITRFDAFELKDMHPDIIFVQQPYDDVNYSMSVYPLFYSKNIKAHTEKLIYVPYFREDEVTLADERAYKNMDYYVTVPGLMHADEVWIWSETMRQTYIRKLTEFAGEETRSIWENKIRVHDMPVEVVNNRLADADIPEEWRDYIFTEDGTRKKVILFNNSLATITEYEEGLIEKLQSIFEIFKEQRNKMTLLWAPQAGISDTIAIINPRLKNIYDALVEKYKASGIGIYDESNDRGRAVAVADAYYGDAGVLAQLCRKAGKPVMIQNVEII